MATTLYETADLKVVFVPRSEWGARQSTEDYIANRRKQTKEDRTGVYVHHTAAIDSDDTPNQWGYDEAVAYMKKLEWVRLSDLGPLPYPMNVAASEDGRTVWIFEGRGLFARPAHEDDLGANTWALAWGALGNFDINTDQAVIRRVLRAVQWHAWQLRHNEGWATLGDRKNPNGWDLWGHRDSSNKTCPGNYLYPLLAEYPFVNWTPEVNMSHYPLYMENAAAPDGDSTQKSDIAKEAAKIRKGLGVGTDVVPSTGAWPQSMVDIVKTEFGGDGTWITGNMAYLIELRFVQAVASGNTGPYLTQEEFEDYVAEVDKEIASLKAFDQKIKDLG